MADGQQQLCFSCDENVRLDGDFLCRSCKEEYRKCYECGERERNHPFKLCTVCYQRLRDGRAVPIPASTSTVTTHSSAFTSGTYFILPVHGKGCTYRMQLSSLTNHSMMLKIIFKNYEFHFLVSNFVVCLWFWQTKAQVLPL